MNIFYLDENPHRAAIYHCDRHVVKMILESAQMLCTIVSQHSTFDVPYKPTHRNHPCTVWASQSRENALWLYALMMELNDEFKHRFHHLEDHKSVRTLKLYDIHNIIDKHIVFPSQGFTTPALAMPDHCKIFNDPVECYRLYYKLEKTALHKWTNRDKPFWI